MTKMTLIRNICADGICTKKLIIYVISVSCILTLLIGALVVVIIRPWTNQSHEDIHGWSYDDEGKWPELCKESKTQSPIALTQISANKQKLEPIKLENFGECECVNVENNGHTVVVNPTACSCQKPKLSGGLLTQNYTMDQFHFHWPSEHTIDGLWYDMEAHFVFYADKYQNFKTALEHPYGLTVMSILFLKNNSAASNNFRTIGDAVKLVSTTAGISTTTTKPINFHDFLPDDRLAFFAYEGSLTTPGCTEFVNWIVYKNHANIADLDYKDVTTIYDDHHVLISKNHRSLQELHGRTVFMPDMGN